MREKELTDRTRVVDRTCPCLQTRDNVTPPPWHHGLLISSTLTNTSQLPYATRRCISPVHMTPAHVLPVMLGPMVEGSGSTCKGLVEAEDKGIKG